MKEIERKRRVLLIGGTGTISSAIVKLLAQSEDWEVWVFNRGNPRYALPENVKQIHGDITNEEEAAQLLKDLTFDCVGEFTGRNPAQMEKDIRLFTGKTKQFIYISSASAYNTPPSTPYITEGMILKNPYWQYSRDKITSEEILLRAFREENFPVTIVRPSHTYGDRFIPFCLESPKGSWPVIKRMIEGKPIIVPGDGSAIWTITYNEDFAKGYAGLVGNPHAIGETVHITTDEIVTWDQMAEAVADALGVEYKPYYIPTDVICKLAPGFSDGLIGDKRHSVIYDNAQLKRLVPGFCATVTWRTGVQRALAVITRDPELMPEDPKFDKWCDELIDIYEEALEKAKTNLTFPM